MYGLEDRSTPVAEGKQGRSPFQKYSELVSHLIFSNISQNRAGDKLELLRKRKSEFIDFGFWIADCGLKGQRAWGMGQRAAGVVIGVCPAEDS